jgi:hypothetical protein
MELADAISARPNRMTLQYLIITLKPYLATMKKENLPVRFQDLITKFYYKQNHLCYQIIFNLGNDETVPYKEFTDYNEYKIAFEKLSKMNQPQNTIPATANEYTKAAMAYV